MEVSNPDRITGPARVLLDGYPELTEAQLGWAQVLIRTGATDLAIQTLNGQLQECKAPWALQALLAELHQKGGDPRAAAELTQADRETPNTADARYIRSLATLDSTVATRCAEKAVQLNEQHRRAWHRLAHLYMHRLDPEKMRIATEKLVALGHAQYSAMAGQGHALLYARRF